VRYGVDEYADVEQHVKGKLLHICTKVQFVTPSLRSSAEITLVRTGRKWWKTVIDSVADEYGQLLCLKRRGFALREREIYTYVMCLVCLQIFLLGCEGKICPLFAYVCWTVDAQFFVIRRVRVALCSRWRTPDSWECLLL